VSLERRRALGGPDRPSAPHGDPADLPDRNAHERRILEAYRDQGKDVRRSRDPDGSGDGETWVQCAADTLALMWAGTDVIRRATLFDGQWLGRPDFLIRRDEHRSDLGAWSYEVVAATATDAVRETALLRTSFQTEMLADAQGREPEYMYLSVDGPELRTERFRVSEHAAHYRTASRRFLDTARPGEDSRPITADTADADLPTYPEPCDHCPRCGWLPACRARWEGDEVEERQETEQETRTG
jgi:uncharacterized protein